ncbi:MULTISPECIES: muconolactone Delta-isomerase family protein [Streptomyces]|uniref:muconolactone Delta-isomerase n=1 Tax=Streptomyces TaxID=1883 RepID=UPI00036A6133|nr:MULTISPECIES: muconolactone Delta-isomerase family protein [Streptomyces]AZM48430.1 muconolactone delta-isomerase [Streptomyces sp. WAC 06738]
MEFLINIRITWPEGMDPEYKDSVSQAERRRAAELAEAGHLVRMWRVPGRTDNWGLWRAADPTEMHAIISSLPVWPWMDVTVHALAVHPVDPKAAEV